MLAIRLQRIGRKALPVYRMAVQESRRHPSSGRVVAYVGSYNPHTKAATLDKEKVAFYLQHGAQPSPRVISLLTSEKVELPAWVKQPNAERKRAIRHPEKLRRNRPATAKTPAEPPVESAEPAKAETQEEKTPEADTEKEEA